MSLFHVGDGGNDVSMIQAADVGIGIVGKEGKQASLAADFSINQFSYVSRLLCMLKIIIVANNVSMAWKKFI